MPKLKIVFCCHADELTLASVTIWSNSRNVTMNSRHKQPALLIAEIKPQLLKSTSPPYYHDCQLLLRELSLGLKNKT